MSRKDWKEYKWIGPERIIPGVGHAKKDRFIAMPLAMAEQFIKVGWIKKPKKGGDSTGTKTVKLSDNVGIGDTGQ